MGLKVVKFHRIAKYCGNYSQVFYTNFNLFLFLWRHQNEKKLFCQMRDAHLDKVTGLRCMPQEPILVTSSPDNTIKQVTFGLPNSEFLKTGHLNCPIFGHPVFGHLQYSSIRHSRYQLSPTRTFKYFWPIQ